MNLTDYLYLVNVEADALVIVDICSTTTMYVSKQFVKFCDTVVYSILRAFWPSGLHILSLYNFTFNSSEVKATRYQFTVKLSVK
jgi:hypothetical protein